MQELGMGNVGVGTWIPGVQNGGSMGGTVFRVPGWRYAGRLACTCLVPILLIAPNAVQGQFDANLGRVTGTVTGPDSLALPGAEVTVTGVASGSQRSVHTDASGHFRVGALRPGEYSVTASSADFATSTVDGVTVSVGGSVRVDLRLDIEQAYSRIDVTAEMLDATLPASSNVVTGKVFNDLPINGRRFHDFALLTPGVQVSRAAGHLSFGAERGISTNVTVDGADYNQAFFGGIQGGERAGSVITVPQSAIQEFQAVTSGFTAEYGRTTSGVVNVSTKSGSNEFHGDMFYQLRDPNLGRRDPFGAVVLERLQQFGGAAGGALSKDRAFWFFAVEHQASVSQRYVEFASLQPQHRERGPEAYDLFKSLEQPFDATNDGLALTPRLDYQFSGGSQLMVRYNYSRSVARNAVSIGDPTQARTNSALSNDGRELDRIHFLTGQLTSVLTPNVINQLRVTFTQEQRPRLPNSEEPAVSTVLGDFGTRAYLPTTERDRRPEFKNSLILHSGAHDLKIGGSANRVWVDDQFGYNQFGNFVLFSSDPGEILDILTPGGLIANRFDAPGLYFRQIGNTLGEQEIGYASLYVQDAWRAAAGLTLDLGFRWEGQFNQDPQVGNDVLIDRVRVADFPFGSPDPAYLPDSVRQWMPRLGFAYSPPGLSGRMVVRASVGTFHAITPPVFFNAATKAFRDPPFNISVALPTGGRTVYQQFLAGGIDLNQYPLAEMPVFSQDEVTRILGGDEYLGAAPYVVSGDFRNPRSVKFSLAAEFGLTANTVVGVQWMRNSTRFLHGLRDYNLPVASVRPDDPARIPYYGNRPRPAPKLDAVFVVESIGRSNYDGVTFNGKYRGGRLQLVGHYTYARAFSGDANLSYFWEPLYSDHARPDDAYGPSDLDMRHQLTGHAVVQLPRGFTWSGIVRAASAPPLSPAAGTDLNGDRFAFDRALETPGRFFGRNVFRNRVMRNLDMRLLKRFATSDTSYLELSLELFNALNLDNVEYGAFNQIYGPGLDLATGTPIPPQDSFLRLRADDGSYDRNNTQVPGTGPLQAQIGLRFIF